jgi:hypothetical protein
VVKCLFIISGIKVIKLLVVKFSPTSCHSTPLRSKYSARNRAPTDCLCAPPNDRFCVLVVRVSGYSDGGLGFDSLRFQILSVAMGLERGPPSLVRIIEELLERKVAAPVYKTEINGHVGSAAMTTRHPSILTKIRRPVVVVQSV